MAFHKAPKHVALFLYIILFTNNSGFCLTAYRLVNFTFSRNNLRSVLLGCDAVSLRKWLSTFRRNLSPESSKVLVFF